jgi:hypothetical protein
VGGARLLWSFGSGEPTIVRIGYLVPGLLFAGTCLRIAFSLVASQQKVSLTIDDQGLNMEGWQSGLGWEEIGRAEVLETELVKEGASSGITGTALVLYGGEKADKAIGQVDGLQHFKTAEGDAALDAIAEAVGARLGEPVPREHRVERNTFAKDKKRIAERWAEIDPIVEERLAAEDTYDPGSKNHVVRVDDLRALEYSLPAIPFLMQNYSNRKIGVTYRVVRGVPTLSKRRSQRGTDGR